MHARLNKLFTEKKDCHARSAFHFVALGFLLAGGFCATAADTDPACRNLTHPAVSPRGDQLLYVSDEAGNLDIFVADFATGQRERLTMSPANETRPSWSKDATQVLFDSDATGNRDVFVMKADGSGVRQLTSNMAEDTFARFSPDGAHVVFHSDRGESRDVFLIDMGSDGGLGDARSLISSAGRDGVPSWSPDGTTVLFHSTRTGKLHFQLFTLDFSKRAIKRLSFTKEPEEHAAFSPDGRHVAFYREHPQRRRNAELMVLDLAAGERQILVQHDRFAAVGEYAQPSWFPDGHSIAFWATEAGETCSSIYFVNLQSRQLHMFR